MPRRPAQIAQSDVARIIRAAKQAGASEVVVKVGKRPNLQIPQFVDIATAEESLAAYLASVESAINQHKPTTLYRHFDKEDDCSTPASLAMFGGAKPIIGTNHTVLIASFV